MARAKARPRATLQWNARMAPQKLVARVAEGGSEAEKRYTAPGPGLGLGLGLGLGPGLGLGSEQVVRVRARARARAR